MVDDNSFWPYNPESLKLAKVIDWTSASKEAMAAARPGMIRKLEVTQLRTLKSRYQSLFDAMPADAREAAEAKMEGRKESEKPTASPLSKKDEILARIERIMSDAVDDPKIQLAGVEMTAKLEALFNQKQEDQGLAARMLKARERLSRAGYYS